MPEIPRGRFDSFIQATFEGGQDARSAGPPARHACNPPSDGVMGGFSESASQDCNLSLPKANQSDDPLTETPPRLSGGPNKSYSPELSQTNVPCVGQ